MTGVAKTDNDTPSTSGATEVSSGVGSVGFGSMEAAALLMGARVLCTELWE